MSTSTEKIISVWTDKKTLGLYAMIHNQSWSGLNYSQETNRSIFKTIRAL